MHKAYLLQFGGRQSALPPLSGCRELSKEPLSDTPVSSFPTPTAFCFGEITVNRKSLTFPLLSVFQQRYGAWTHSRLPARCCVACRCCTALLSPCPVDGCGNWTQLGAAGCSCWALRWSGPEKGRLLMARGGPDLVLSGWVPTSPWCGGVLGLTTHGAWKWARVFETCCTQGSTDQ